MLSAAQSQIERAEFETILRSGIFNRAPNLQSFLRYVCERYFEGEGSQIKEYSIAVEALGRPPEFDQKKDSIVRVEAHRLRKRLAEYYAGPGADHSIKLSIANGQYAPQFFHSEPRSAEPKPVDSHPASPNLVALEQFDFVARRAARKSSLPLQWRKFAQILGLCFSILIATGLIYWGSHRQPKKPARPSVNPAQQEVWRGNPNTPVSSEFRMLAGFSGPAYTDRQGHKWEPDAYFRGGRSLPLSSDKVIEGLPDPNLLHSSREGEFAYDIPLRSGTYELHLYFSETTPTHGNPSEGDAVRAFRIGINGQTRLDLFDALSEAGGANRLQVRTFRDITPAADGRLHLQFAGQSGQPFLNALEILPSLPGRIRPIRIVALKTPITDTEGRVWSADEFVMGGHLTERSNSVLNSREKNLFEGERFGNFSYHLPVAPGNIGLLCISPRHISAATCPMLPRSKRDLDCSMSLPTA